MFNFQGPWSLKSRYRIPEGPPVPIPNTEVKLRRAENTLPVTAREDRSAPTFWLSPSAQSEKARRGKGTVERRFFSGKKKEDKILRIFSILIQVLFLPLISSSRSTKYAFGARSRGLHLKPFAKRAFALDAKEPGFVLSGYEVRLRDENEDSAFGIDCPSPPPLTGV